jgi:hypothetical protein
MKDDHVVESLSALSLHANALPVAGAEEASDPRAPLAAGGDERDAARVAAQVRAMLEERYTAPYDVGATYRHWGINE